MRAAPTEFNDDHRFYGFSSQLISRTGITNKEPVRCRKNSISYLDYISMCALRHFQNLFLQIFRTYFYFTSKRLYLTSTSASMQPCVFLDYLMSIEKGFEIVDQYSLADCKDSNSTRFARPLGSYHFSFDLLLIQT
jgi:hypothetical protein